MYTGLYPGVTDVSREVYPGVTDVSREVYPGWLVCTGCTTRDGGYARGVLPGYPGGYERTMVGIVHPEVWERDHGGHSTP